MATLYNEVKIFILSLNRKICRIIICSHVMLRIKILSPISEKDGGPNIELTGYPKY
jgi:hypothetical protein